MNFFWHKLKHWEFWPVQLVYLPTLIYWLLLALRYRSLHFYRYANPGIRNGGLYADSKMEIYQLLPFGTYPKTIKIDVQESEELDMLMKRSNLQFPCIAKPDIGQRGENVQRVHSMKELLNYAKLQERGFLIQELIELPNELGLFYVREPNQRSGRITGITLKKFLIVKGNGKDSIRKLLQRNRRFAMQLEKLSEQIDLEEILADGIERCLVPYGNHNRGTEFLDGGSALCKDLEPFFTGILDRVRGFNYGRLDIRYHTLEELKKGQNFSIIELNGAKSEPTHMYDPKHSFWYGQREIFRHQVLFNNIVAANRKLLLKNPSLDFSLVVNH